MSELPQDNPVNAEVKTDDSEKNLVKQRRYYEKQIEERESEKTLLLKRIEQAEKVAQESLAHQQKSDDDDSSDEPYVDHKKLKKELAKVVNQTATETDTRIQTAVNRALSEERQKQWMKNNPDFYEIMQYAQAFHDKDPELAETILEMPEGFERQKLVYKNIKALGLHKKEEPKINIQDKIDQNRRSPSYQPSGVGAAPYASAGDFTPTGQKTAYQKMQELKNRLRL